MIRIAILDDYQNASLEMADWSPLAGRAEITVFNDHLSDFDNVVERLLPFDVVCVMMALGFVSGCRWAQLSEPGTAWDCVTNCQFARDLRDQLGNDLARTHPEYRLEKRAG